MEEIHIDSETNSFACRDYDPSQNKQSGPPLLPVERTDMSPDGRRPPLDGPVWTPTFGRTWTPTAPLPDCGPRSFSFI